MNILPKSKTSLNEMLYEIRRIAESREKLTDKKIEAIYKTLEKDLNSFLAEQYIKFSDSDGRMYIAYLDKERKRAWFMNEIAKNVDGVTPALKKEIITLVDKTYSECYKGMLQAVKTADTADKLKRVTKYLDVRPEVLKQAVNNNISKLTLPKVLEKNRADIIYQIQQDLNIGLLNGDRYETMAKRISERVNISKGKAMNITRTETHRNIESGFMDSAERLSEGLEGSDLIYAATWRTMKDERVRPQQRRHTSKGWVTSRSTSGANHIVMENETVKVGEMFTLSDGNKTKAPSQSGVAAQDCNCRCYLEYNLLTVEEFAALTDQTEEQVRKKYKMGNKSTNIPTQNEEVEEIPVMAQTPKSLEKFDEYQEQWVSDNFAHLSPKQREILEQGIQKVLDNNAYSMRVNSRDLQSIIDNGFLNQLETKKSGGTLSASSRKLASQRLFNGDVMNMNPAEFEKYGYLGSYDFIMDDATSDAWQYGKTIVKFNKDRLKGRVTYTIDDSLGNALYNRVIGGKISDKSSISGIPKYDVGDVISTFKYAEHSDWLNADQIAQDMGCRYWELQYHGDLGIGDVESICFTMGERTNAKIVSQLKELGIKVYRLTKGGNLKEL